VTGGSRTGGGPVSHMGRERESAGMRKWPVIGVLLLGGGVAVYSGTTGSLPFMAKSAAPRPPAVRVPVSAAEVQRMDVPVDLNGIGTVQAFNSVVVKSRVDGQIVKINFSEGKDVHAGDVLVEIDPRPFEASLDQAKANELKDEAQLTNARLDLARAGQLTAAGHGSKQQLDTAQALVAQLEATVKADEAMNDMAQTQLSYSRIKSPIDGRAGTRLVDAGNIVRATDNGGVVSINQLHPIFVNFSLPADSLPPIRARLKEGEIKVTAQDANGSDLANGTLFVIDNQINTATGTITYKATFDNDGEVLWPGQFVNVRVELDVRRNVVAVPVTAVQQGPDGTFAFVVGQDRKVLKRVIKVGEVNKTTAIIDDGIQTGDVVVTEGQYRIQAGTTVDVLGNPTASRTLAP
jgi:membrane fusion protein, multidrug efflux system